MDTNDNNNNIIVESLFVSVSETRRSSGKDFFRSAERVCDVRFVWSDDDDVH